MLSTFTTSAPALTVSALLQDYASYNLWANTTLANWLRTKPEDNMHITVPSSFSSIRATLLHIWATENYWLSMICQKEYVPIDAEHYDGDFDSIIDGLLETSERLLAFTDTLEDDAATGELFYDSPWVKGFRPLVQYGMHVFNHSTYHRGQIVTIGRGIGYKDAPMTDFNFYNFFAK